MIIQNAKKRLQFLLCLWVDEPEFFFALEKIIQRLAVVLGISKVIPGCADPIHDHLCHIFTRHLRPHDHMLPIKRIVDPVLKMMLVPALVMEPGSGHSDIFPLCIIRASRSLIIFTSHQKFCRCILGKVVKQSLLI